MMVTIYLSLICISFESVSRDLLQNNLEYFIQYSLSKYLY